jgi:hypothetical protein
MKVLGELVAIQSADIEQLQMELYGGTHNATVFLCQKSKTH